MKHFPRTWTQATRQEKSKAEQLSPQPVKQQTQKGGSVVFRCRKAPIKGLANCLLQVLFKCGYSAFSASAFVL